MESLLKGVARYVLTWDLSTTYRPVFFLSRFCLLSFDIAKVR